jgi:hypothetical protein
VGERARKEEKELSNVTIIFMMMALRVQERVREMCRQHLANCMQKGYLTRKIIEKFC